MKLLNGLGAGKGNARGSPWGAMIETNHIWCRKVPRIAGRQRL